MEKVLMRYPRELQKVVDFLNEAKRKYPDSELGNGGSIIYANGNDGTDFDWECNERLCEFGFSHVGEDVWAFKCYVYNDGEAEIYCYPNGEMKPVETIKKSILSKDDVEWLYEIMIHEADEAGKYDMPLEEIFK